MKKAFAKQMIYSKFVNQMKRQFSTAGAKEIFIQTEQLNYYYPTKGAPTFTNGYYTLFEYKLEPVKSDKEGLFQRLPQVPYEIKECALKGFLYSFFLTWFGRLVSAFNPAFATSLGISGFSLIPASALLYQYFKALNYMLNAVSAIRLKENGTHVVFEFKNNIRPKVEVEIRTIKKKVEENFFAECYSEPFLFPLIVDLTHQTGPYSLFNKRKYYLHGDSHKCILDGELLRAVVNGKPIKLN